MNGDGDKQAMTCKTAYVMSAWSEMDELFEDLKDLDDKDLLKVRKTMRERAEKALDFLNKGCDITDEDVLFWTE